MGTISVKQLGKAYKQYKGRWSRLAEWLPFSSKTRHVLKWVLQDINFEIQAGEAIGIVGINGAGKSTLLKMITGGEEEENRDFNWYGNPLNTHSLFIPPFLLTCFLIYYKRGLDETNTQEFRKCLLDDCVEMISSNLDAARDTQITVDVMLLAL